MSITIKEIAELAGVSRGTVDRALHNKYGLSEEVKKRVLEIAKEYNYSPNLCARMLSANQQGGIKFGVVIVSNNNPFFDDIIDAVNQNLNSIKEFGVNAIIKIQNKYDVQEQLDILNEFEKEKVKGILITPINDITIENKITELSQSGTKVVTLNSDFSSAERLAFVGCDFEKSGVILGEMIQLMCADRPVKLCLLTDAHKNLAVIKRTQGLIDFVSKQGEQIQIIEKYNNDESDELAYEYTNEIIKAKNCDFICVMGSGISGVLKAIWEADDAEKLPKVFSYDIIDATKQGFEKGNILAAITQEPQRQGSLGVQILFDSIVRNLTVEKVLNYTELNIKTKNCI